METTDIVDTVTEPLSDPNFKGIFAGLALATATVAAAGFAFKKLRARKEHRHELTLAESKNDQL